MKFQIFQRYLSTIGLSGIPLNFAPTQFNDRKDLTPCKTIIDSALGLHSIAYTQNDSKFGFWQGSGANFCVWRMRPLLNSASDDRKFAARLARPKTKF